MPHLAYAGSGHEVKTRMVAGKVLLRDGCVLTADEAAVRAEAYGQAEDVAQAGLARARAEQGETE